MKRAGCFVFSLTAASFVPSAAAEEAALTAVPGEPVVDPEAWRAEGLEGLTEAAATLVEPSYWNSVYNAKPTLSNGPLIHSWQGVDFKALQPMLQPLIHGSHALVLGCGDSPLPEELLKAGAAKVTGIDFSTDIVASMTARTRETHPQITWLVKDLAGDLGLASKVFDLALDVGVLDVVSVGKEKERAQQMVTQAYQALRPNGTYISVSSEPPIFRKQLFDAYPAGGWSTAVETLPRPRALDPRVLALDPEYTVGNLSVYLNRAVDAEADQKRAEELARLARVAAERGDVPVADGAAELDSTAQPTADSSGQQAQQPAEQQAPAERIEAEAAGEAAEQAAEPEAAQPGEAAAAEEAQQDVASAAPEGSGDAVCSAESPETCKT